MTDFEKMMELAFQNMKTQHAELSDQPIFEITEAEEIMLPMTDGVKLRTIIRKPTDEGPFPTIIVRTCYPHGERIQNLKAEEYCKRGFAFVYQYCRGSGGSGGKWEPNVNERADGKVTLDWLDAQEWVENIGYFGSSYLALTGWAIADIIPNKLKTLYLTHYGTDRFTSAYKNGLFRQDILTSWAMDNAGSPITADYLESVSYRPQINVDEKLWGMHLNWYRDWITNTQRSDPYWQVGFWKLLSEIPSKVKVPVYIGEGWYDHHLGSALKTWESLSSESKKHSVLRLGAWNHGFMPCVDGITANNIENSDVKSSYEWFDGILRKKTLPKAGVSIYRIVADSWEHVSSYPFKRNKQEEYYLSDYGLENALSVLEGSRSYSYNPDNPVTIHGAESLFKSITGVGSRIQPECNYRDDVLSFVSAPLDNKLDILGKIIVELYVSTDAEDTAFTARLMEVREDGTYNVRGSIATLAFRDGETRGSYTPGEIVKLTIDMWDIAWRFQKGSKLRLDISSSAFPEYAVHTNKAGVWSVQEDAVITKQTLHFGGKYPSKIVLPL